MAVKLTKHFGMSAVPFNKDVQPLFQYRQLEQLHELLELAVETDSGTLVTGQAGTGKTTAVRGFVDTLASNKYRIIYLGYDQKGNTLFARLGLELGLKVSASRAYRMLQLKQHIQRTISGAGKKLILIVDEGHLLEGSALEDIRLLTNSDMDRRSDVVLFLLGQLWLRTKLKNHGHEALYQRLRFRYGLEGLTLQQTKEYVAHHLQLVNGDPSIFTEPALRSIFQASGGILREVNNLAVDCLLNACSQGSSKVDEKLVRLVLDQRESA